MLHDEHGVAEITQALERVEQARVVALVESDARLVEDVEHADQPRSDLCGQPDALRFATRERFGGAIEREVLETDIHEKAQALAHFLEDRAGDPGVEPRALLGTDRDALGEGERVGRRAFGECADVPAMQRDRERLRLEALAAAIRALGDHHVPLEVGAHGVGGGFGVAALHVREDTFPARGVVSLLLAARGAEEQLELHAVGELSPGRVQFELELLGEAREDHAPEIAVGLAPREDHAFEDRDRGVAKDELRARGALGAQAAAGAAGAEWRVEREVARLEFRERDAAVGTAVLLGEEVRALTVVMAHHFDQPFGESQRGLDRVSDAPAVVLPHREAVDHHRDVVVLPTIQLGRVGELDQRAIHDGADEALLERVLEELAELALSPADERREDLDLRARRPGEHLIGDLRRRLTSYRATAVGAVRRAGARVEQAQVIVDLGDRADGGARIGAGRLLFDRDRGGEPLDRVDIGLLHQPEELTGVRRERLHVPPLAFSEDRVERERGLP